MRAAKSLVSFRFVIHAWDPLALVGDLHTLNLAPSRSRSSRHGLVGWYLMEANRYPNYWLLLAISGGKG